MLLPLIHPPEGCPLPQGGITQTITTPDGAYLRMATWPRFPQAPERGTILLLQGRAEFIEKYAETITKLTQLGFVVTTFDWRGQGGSSRLLRNPRKGHVEEFEDYIIDFEAVIQKMHQSAMPKPWNVLAHSMGGAIALKALARGGSPLRRAVLCAPLVKVTGFGGTIFAKILARALASIGMSTAFVPGGKDKAMSEGAFEANLLTRDAARFAHARAILTAEPRLALGDPTIGWVDAMFSTIEEFDENQFGMKNTTPILMLLAGADKIVDSRAAHRLAARMRGTNALEIQGAYHEMMMEREEIRQLFWAGFLAFLGVDEQNEEAQNKDKEEGEIVANLQTDDSTKN